MGLNTQSETSPTGGTTTLNTNYDPSIWNRVSSHFYNELDHEAVYGGHYPSEAFRPAAYMQNWSGIQQWQSWNSLGGMFNGERDYPVNYRVYVTRGNVADTVDLLLSRNQPQQYAPAPIAISMYALNTQQVYNGGSDFYG